LRARDFRRISLVVFTSGGVNMLACRGTRAHTSLVRSLLGPLATIAALVTGMSHGGCSKADPGPKASSNTIGPAGGMVDGNDGSYLVIPPGALQTTVTITMTPVPNDSMPGGGVSGGSAVVLGPEGLRFTIPIEVYMVFENLPAGVSPTDLRLFTAPAGADGYAYQLPTTVADDAHLMAKTTHFSEVYIGRVHTTGAPDGSGGGICVSFGTPDASKCTDVCQCTDGAPCPNSDRFQCPCATGGTTCPGALGCCGNSCLPPDNAPDSACAQCANGLPSCKGSSDAGSEAGSDAGSGAMVCAVIYEWPISGSVGCICKPKWTEAAAAAEHGGAKAIAQWDPPSCPKSANSLTGTSVALACCIKATDGSFCSCSADDFAGGTCADYATSQSAAQVPTCP
jgi:hypothetical protein